jgi:2-polyprenyl-3-methyl-5-hydroxy-6-metoxy-1,4-benzoquinol methylase
VAVFNPSYVGFRPEVMALVPATALRVLDVGCATGQLGAALKARTPGVEVCGIEVDAAMAKIAGEHLDAVVVASAEDLDSLDRELGAAQYDCIICGDLLEHLVDPWRFLRWAGRMTVARGVLVASLPNVGHLDTLASVFVRKTWPMRERGIHDRTHLRFFARRDLGGLLAAGSFEIRALRRTYRVLERPHRINLAAKYLAAPGLRDLLTYQFLLLAEKNDDSVS